MDELKIFARKKSVDVEHIVSVLILVDDEHVDCDVGMPGEGGFHHEMEKIRIDDLVVDTDEGTVELREFGKKFGWIK